MNLEFKKRFSQRFDLPKSQSLERSLKSFSLTEKTLFWIFAFLMVASALGLLIKVNNSFLVEVPDNGGKITEGIVGSPRFVNPVLAISDADKDLVTLVYSGLLRATPEGDFLPDLAESYSVSPDGLTYSFILKEDARFHDGKKVTADDIEFTIARIQDPAVKSPKRGSWDGVAIEKIRDSEIHFTLKQPYAPFLENTTIGILPKHLWKNTNSDEFAFSELNIEPIGSGPYKVKSVGKNSSKTPNEYELGSFKKYALGEPHITKLIIKFYSNENDLIEAYQKGDVEGMGGIAAKNATALSSKKIVFEETILPRIFGIFFNQNQAHIFANKEVRIALDTAINKHALVQDILSGYGQPIDGPIPPSSALEDNKELSEIPEEERIAKAKSILEKSGWKQNAETGIYEKKTKTENLTLTFTITTSDAQELKLAAQRIQSDWQKIGAKVDLEIFETGDLNQNVIRPRKYDALFFGEIVGRDMDLYPFWHSSQRNDPGLNIAMYVNSKVDKLLEEARTISSKDERTAKYSEIEKIIKDDVPAVFVYSPSFIYIVPKKVQNVRLGQLTVPGERFLNIFEWYTRTNKVWKIFANN